MKKNKINKLIFTDKWGHYPDNTCELISNFIKNIIKSMIALFAICVSTPFFLSPLFLLNSNIPMFPIKTHTFNDKLGEIGSIVLVIYSLVFIISVIVFFWNRTSNLAFIKDIVSSIRNKTCFKVEWKE